MDDRLLKILNESTLLLITPNGKECKININDMKSCATLALDESVWNSFLNYIKINHQSNEYNLRPHD